MSLLFVDCCVVSFQCDTSKIIASWFSHEVKKLLKRILDPNPFTVISEPKAFLFLHNYLPPIYINTFLTNSKKLRNILIKNYFEGNLIKWENKFCQKWSYMLGWRFCVFFPFGPFCLDFVLCDSNPLITLQYINIGLLFAEDKNSCVFPPFGPFCLDFVLCDSNPLITLQYINIGLLFAEDKNSWT